MSKNGNLTDHDYLNNYLKAIDHPLPQLKKTFDSEIGFLKKHVKKDFIVLDVGCGVGRPTINLSRFVEKIIGIDNKQEMLSIAIKRSIKSGKIKFEKCDAFKMNFFDEAFDLTYATYNLVGGFTKKHVQNFINEMTRVTKKNHEVINICWKNDRKTTEFLKLYYPYISVKIIDINMARIITNKGTFRRPYKKELKSLYKNAKLKNIRFFDVNPLWKAVIGTK